MTSSLMTSCPHEEAMDERAARQASEPDSTLLVSWWILMKPTTHDYMKKRRHQDHRYVDSPAIEPADIHKLVNL